jgi:hypothetical protein
MNKGLEKDHKYHFEAFKVMRFTEHDSNFSIENEDLVFIEAGNLVGLQCNHSGDSPQHRLIKMKLKKVSKLLKEVESLNEF